MKTVGDDAGANNDNGEHGGMMMSMAPSDRKHYKHITQFLF